MTSSTMCDDEVSSGNFILSAGSIVASAGLGGLAAEPLFEVRRED